MRYGRQEQIFTYIQFLAFRALKGEDMPLFRFPDQSQPAGRHVEAHHFPPFRNLAWLAPFCLGLISDLCASLPRLHSVRASLSRIILSPDHICEWIAKRIRLKNHPWFLDWADWFVVLAFELEWRSDLVPIRMLAYTPPFFGFSAFHVMNDAAPDGSRTNTANSISLWRTASTGSSPCRVLVGVEEKRQQTQICERTGIA
jgi:hypothetical protein